MNLMARIRMCNLHFECLYMGYLVKELQKQNCLKLLRKKFLSLRIQLIVNLDLIFKQRKNLFVWC